MRPGCGSTARSINCGFCSPAKKITSTTAALGLLLANQPGIAVPGALTSTVTGAALASGAAGIGGAALFIFMNLKTTLPVLGAVGALGFAAYKNVEARRAREEASALAQERDGLREHVRVTRERSAATR